MAEYPKWKAYTLFGANVFTASTASALGVLATGSAPAPRMIVSTQYNEVDWHHDGARHLCWVEVRLLLPTGLSHHADTLFAIESRDCAQHFARRLTVVEHHYFGDRQDGRGRVFVTPPMNSQEQVIEAVGPALDFVGRLLQVECGVLVGDEPQCVQLLNDVVGWLPAVEIDL